MLALTRWIHCQIFRANIESQIYVWACFDIKARWMKGAALFNCDLGENLDLEDRCVPADAFINLWVLFSSACGNRCFTVLLDKTRSFGFNCFNTEDDVADCNFYIIHNSRANGALMYLTILLHFKDSVTCVPYREGRKERKNQEVIIEKLVERTYPKFQCSS